MEVLVVVPSQCGRSRMAKRKTVQVGGLLREALGEVADTSIRATEGRGVTASDRTMFVSWSALASVMTDKRQALIAYLHAHPTPSIRAVARAIERDYKRVHEDLTALAAVGLATHEGGQWRADYDEISAVLKVQAAA
jgi:predicted transcriptional regulator